jgi:4-hydroxy-3-methylbut-2-enyl diphosphate reductase
MIHNPDVNADLTANGIRFIQDTDGSQIIEWEELTANDIVIIPAFGTTVEIEAILRNIGVNIEKYNTTCPFVEKVWNRSEKLGSDNHTVIIHGKYNHEETRATFSHSVQNASALIIKDLEEAKFLGSVIRGEVSSDEFLAYFKGKYSEGFNPEKDLLKIGVVNQTTQLATDTQAISDYLKQIVLKKFGPENVTAHFADTRDTLCYATNDNQSATLGLLEQEADLAVVVGGYNSSNTSHLVELLERKFPTYYIKDASEIKGTSVQHFNYHQKEMQYTEAFLPQQEKVSIVLTSGASCPDSIVENVMYQLLQTRYSEPELKALLAELN